MNDLLMFIVEFVNIDSINIVTKTIKKKYSGD